MNSKPQSKKNKKPDDDSRIKKLIDERSALNETLNRLLEKIKKDQKE